MNLNKNKKDKKDEFEDLINYNLNKFFLKDIYVTLTSYKLPVSVIAVVIDYASNILSVRFKDSNYTKNLQIGDPIIINITNNDTVYSASASIVSYYSTTMDLKIEKVTSKDDLRKEKRFLVALRGRVEFNNDKSFIIIKNLSQHGLSFSSKLNIPINSEISIYFNTYEFFQVSLIGKVVQKNSLADNYSYGISIKHIDNRSLRNLNVCIRNLIHTFEI